MSFAEGDLVQDVSSHNIIRHRKERLHGIFANLAIPTIVDVRVNNSERQSGIRKILIKRNF